MSCGICSVRRNFSRDNRRESAFSVKDGMILEIRRPIRKSRPAHGTIPALRATRVSRHRSRIRCPGMVGNPSLSPSRQESWFPGQGPGSRTPRAVRKFDCHGTILVADRDRDAGRRAELEEGVDRARTLFANHPTAWGLAVESIEAWTLAVPDKIAEELGVSVKLVQQQYPGGTHVESLVEGSGKPDHRPKLLLDRIAQLKHRNDSTDLRQAIAERTDVEALERACPQGFAPFAAKLRAAFGQVS